MRPCTPILALLAVFVVGQAAVSAEGEDTLIRAPVRRVLSPQLFSLEYQAGVDGELIVLAIDTDATPVPGATILVGGALRKVSEGVLKATTGWDQVDARTRDSLAARPILVASSIRTAAGRQLLGAAPPAGRAARQVVREDPPGTRAPGWSCVWSGALADLIDEVGGHQVRLPRARVLVVINPQAFLVESASPLPPLVGNLDRVLVLINAGTLRVEPALLVGTNVTVLGAARTLLGLQVTNEVPWPQILTRQVTDRYEIKAAVLATSVQTADGVELTSRQ
jgi:hypothetical protein